MSRSNSPVAPAPARHAAAPSCPSPLRTIRAVAGLLGVHERTVHRLIARGELAAHRIGRGVRVSEADLRAYLDRCR
jgi:excisionase family DNA binding protein